jgi:hypothetical protein
MFPRNIQHSHTLNFTIIMIQSWRLTTRRVRSFYTQFLDSRRQFWFRQSFWYQYNKAYILDKSFVYVFHPPGLTEKDARCVLETFSDTFKERGQCVESLRIFEEDSIVFLKTWRP